MLYQVESRPSASYAGHTLRSAKFAALSALKLACVHTGFQRSTDWLPSTTQPLLLRTLAKSTSRIHSNFDLKTSGLIGRIFSSSPLSVRVFSLCAVRIFPSSTLLYFVFFKFFSLYQFQSKLVWNSGKSRKQQVTEHSPDIQQFVKRKGNQGSSPLCF